MNTYNRTLARVRQAGFKRLSDSQVYRELSRYKATGDLGARDRVFFANLGLVSGVVTSIQRYPEEIDFANAVRGLLQAIEMGTYDPRKGSFATYAWRFMVGAVADEYRVIDAVRFPHDKLSEREAVCLEDRDAENEIDADPVDPVEQVIDAGLLHVAVEPEYWTPEKLDWSSVEELLWKLTPSEREVVEGVYLDGKSATEVARETGYSRQTIYQWRNSGLAKLRKWLGVKEAKQDSEATPRLGTQFRTRKGLPIKTSEPWILHGRKFPTYSAAVASLKEAA